MRTRLLLCCAALLLAGCGNRRVMLGVDALSFTQPQDRSMAFGPVPALPVPVSTGELAVIDDQHVNMFQGVHNVVDVESVSLSFSADVADSTGNGLDTLRVYLSDSGTNPRQTPAVVQLPFVLAPGQHVPLHVDITGDPRINALFTQQEMRMTVTTSLQGPSSGQALNGRIAVTELRAAVIARQHSL